MPLFKMLIYPHIPEKTFVFPTSYVIIINNSLVEGGHTYEKI